MRAHETDPRRHAAGRRTASRRRIPALEQLVDRFEPEVFDVRPPGARIRVQLERPRQTHDAIERLLRR